ncbi:HAD family hydrolase [Granulicella cerasi]|uniref:HAD family hydrolase n=1 Tax=Granulicella cerasi TaxID=741063 RepID=A0ABW1Z7Q9_9BACT|nr:HAD-IA family hydrolase [Granulicella cerasi]
MKLTIPQGDFDAYLFDCDGTIVDSMPLHYVAWHKMLAEYNCPFPEEQFYAYGGLPVETILEMLNEQHGLSMPVKQVAHEKELYYQGLVHTIDGIPMTIDHIHDKHGKIPFAVVSGSPRKSVVDSLEALGLLDKFEVLVCAGEYSKGKPHPEPFLKAAELLGVDPKRCLVFEDAQPGIDAAEAAGMQWVRVPLPKERLAAAEAAR